MTGTAARMANWLVVRKERSKILPRYIVTDDLVVVRGDGWIEQEFDLEDLKKTVRCLDNNDMRAFFFHVIFADHDAFEMMFTPEFVGTDSRLAYIRDFIASAAHGPEVFFDGPKQADRTKVFSVSSA